MPSLPIEYTNRSMYIDLYNLQCGYMMKISQRIQYIVLIYLSWLPKIEIPNVPILLEKMHKHHKSFIVAE